MRDRVLSEAIASVLGDLERDGDLVVTSSTLGPVVERIADAVLGVVPHTSLSQLELHGVRSLIQHAIADQRFFDWEMPTLTGFTAEEFGHIADKLPRE